MVGSHHGFAPLKHVLSVRPVLAHLAVIRQSREMLSVSCSLSDSSTASTAPLHCTCHAKHPQPQWESHCFHSSRAWERCPQEGALLRAPSHLHQVPPDSTKQQEREAADAGPASSVTRAVTVTQTSLSICRCQRHSLACLSCVWGS